MILSQFFTVCHHWFFAPPDVWVSRTIVSSNWLAIRLISGLFIWCHIHHFLKTRLNFLAKFGEISLDDEREWLSLFTLHLMSSKLWFPETSLIMLVIFCLRKHANANKMINRFVCFAAEKKSMAATSDYIYRSVWGFCSLHYKGHSKILLAEGFRDNFI